MAPMLTFVATLAAVVAAASGQAVPAAGALRGGARQLQEGMCNFIGCPDGKIPIDDAMNVMCNSDPCSVEQCCMANCSFHPCPNNFIPIPMASETMCPTSGCTTDLCCVDGNVPPPPMPPTTPSPVPDIPTPEPTFSFDFGDDMGGARW